MMKENIKVVAASEENAKVYTFSVDYAKLIARVAGFETVEQYFKRSTISHKLHQISVPMFFLSSEDDPGNSPFWPLKWQDTDGCY